MSAEDISLNENPETSGQKHETKDSQLELFAVSTNDNIQQGDVPQNEIDDNETSKNIIVEDFAVEMRKSYLDYARTVVADRALPDVRDGLKPVQRRVLFGMDGLGLASSGAHKKSARIVGEVMGKYHPHGDSSIYDTMVRMAQDFSLRTTLVDGQGNFGSLDGDSAAAMRYTEAKLTTTGEHLMADMRENTVDFVPNFDETLEEPSVLPSKFPNLIVNGTSGIAVGMSTSMAPHNPGETFSAIVYRLNHPDCGIDDIFKILPGPDFPTGGIVSSESLREIYSTGKGRVRIRSKTTIEETTKRKNIVVSEIPYGVNKGNLVSSIATVLRDSGADGIVAIRDESGRDGVRIVVELHKRADAAAILDMLFKKTPLETTFSVQNLALERRNGEMVPRQYDIMGLIDAFIAHRVDVVTRRTKFRLDKAEKHLHIVEGLLRAISMIQSIIDTIRNSKTIGEAKKKLTESPFDFSILQAEAILDMKLQRLVALQEKELVKEKDTLTSDIKKYGKILSDRRALNAVITGETEELRSIYNSPRRTAIVERFEIHEGTSAVSFRGKDAPVVKKGTTYVFLGEDGLLFSKCYRRGTPGAGHEAGVVTAVECPSSGNIVCITNIGGAYSCPISEIPEPNGKRGKPVSGIFGFSSEECVSLLFFVPDEIRDNPEHPASNDRIFSVLRTIQDGKTKLKSTSLSEFASWRRKTGKSICPDGCILVSVLYGQVSDNLAFLTRKEKFLSVSCNEIPVQGIGSNGVQGMKLEDGDEITKVILWSVKTTHILFLMKNGYAKKIETSENLIQGRSTKGVSVARPSRMSACVDMVPLSAEFPKNGIVVVESGWHKVADIPVSELSQSKTSLFAVPLTTPVPETQDAFSDASSEGDASDVDERNQEITPESEETPIQDEGGGD